MGVKPQGAASKKLKKTYVLSNCINLKLGENQRSALEAHLPETNGNRNVSINKHSLGISVVNELDTVQKPDKYRPRYIKEI